MEWYVSAQETCKGRENSFERDCCRFENLLVFPSRDRRRFITVSAKGIDFLGMRPLGTHDRNATICSRTLSFRGLFHRSLKWHFVIFLLGWFGIGFSSVQADEVSLVSGGIRHRSKRIRFHSTYWALLFCEN